MSMCGLRRNWRATGWKKDLANLASGKYGVGKKAIEPKESNMKRLIPGCPEGEGPRTPRRSIQALMKEAEKEAEAKQIVCEVLKCQVLRLPARMGVPFGFHAEDGRVLGWADIIYMPHLGSGIEYSVEKQGKAYSVAKTTCIPSYLLIATDDGIYGLDMRDKPAKVGISHVFRTEDTDEIVPFVFYEAEQFRVLAIDDDLTKKLLRKD